MKKPEDARLVTIQGPNGSDELLLLHIFLITLAKYGFHDRLIIG